MSLVLALSISLVGAGARPEPALSAGSGGTIVFGSNRDGDWDIYAVNRDGTGLTQLTHNELEDSSPTPSPDGKLIAFCSEDGSTVSDPVPYRHNPHRIFGGPYSLTGVDKVQLFSQDRLDSGHPRLHFSVFFGDEPPPFTQPHVVAVRSLVDGRQGYPISGLNGSWIHLAGVWDRFGIAGSADTLRLYVNGEVVAASRARGWGTTPCASRRPAGQWRYFTDVGGCNDTCANAFAVDNLKLWNYAKTDYSDRFKESP